MRTLNIAMQHCSAASCVIHISSPCRFGCTLHDDITSLKCCYFFFFSVFFYALAPVPTIIAKRFSEDFSSNGSK